MAEAQAPGSKPTGMEFVFDSMPRFKKTELPLSEWLLKLEQRFALTEITSHQKRIKLCAVYIGQSGEDILGGLPADATWDDAKAALIARLGGGTQMDEAYDALKKIKRGERDIQDLANEIEKLTRLAFPGDETIRERQTLETFLSVLEPRIAREVRKLGYTRYADVLAAAKRIEVIQKEEGPPPDLASYMSILTDHLDKGLQNIKKELRDTPGVHLTQAPAPSTPASAPSPAPVLSATPSLPPTHFLQAYHPPSRPPPRRHQPSAPRRCFLCNDEGHFVRDCPFRGWFEQMRVQGPSPDKPLALPAPSPRPKPDLNS